MQSPWIDRIIAFIAFFIAIMSWFSIKPTEVGKAIQKIEPLIREVGGLVVISVGIAVITLRTIQRLIKGHIPWEQLVVLAICIFCFLWSLIMILSH